MTDDAPNMVRRDGSPITSGRIRPALETAIRLIVTEGYAIADAAKAVGYREHSLIQALKKPHVRAFRAGVKRAWLESQTSKAWLTVANLAANAVSEDVRLKASRTFLDAAGELTPDAKGQAGPSQLIQIITRAVDIGGQPLDQRLPGVIEAPAWKAIDAKPSDSGEV